MKPEYIEQHGMLIDGNAWQVHPQTGETWNKASIAAFIDNDQAEGSTTDLEALKTAAIVNIKRQAADRIVAFDWQLQRAEERLSQAEIGAVLGNESALERAENQLLEILDAREAIRTQSSLAEERLMALEDIAAIESFSW